MRYTRQEKPQAPQAKPRPQDRPRAWERDAFGIGAALQGVAGVYFQTARRTGRTAGLVQILQDGDTVICLDKSHAEHLQRRIREADQYRDRPREVRTYALSADLATAWQEKRLRAPRNGRLYFDHGWVEEYFRQILQEATKSLGELQDTLSAPGTDPIETDRGWIERERWRD